MKIFPDAITQTCSKSLQYLHRQEFIKDFYLAGGTALALQIGHRISTDLDWFSTSTTLNESARDDIRKSLEPSGVFETMMERDGSLYTRLYGIDVSFIHQRHPLLEATLDYQDVHLASPVDIGLMKLAAINSRGTRRDFIDLYSLKEVAPLNILLDLAPKKYFDRPSFLAISARALVYFDDAEQQPMPNTLVPISWQDVKAYCESAATALTRRLSGLA
jgi:predicted nucleotidyltransferase component of viral defense system